MRSARLGRRTAAGVWGGAVLPPRVKDIAELVAEALSDAERDGAAVPRETRTPE